MTTHGASHGLNEAMVVKRRFPMPRIPHGSLTFRLLILVLIAIFPAVIVTAIYGQHGTAKLLVLSQVILSMQLSFAVIPLVMFTSDRHKMGEFVNPAWLKILSWFVAIAIACLNAWLLFQSIWG